MLVVDSSFLVAVLFEEEHTAFAVDRLSQAMGEGLTAPGLLRWEVANVLRNKVVRKLTTIEDAVARLDALAALSISHPEREASAEALLALSLDAGLTAYDAAYFELAARLDAPLATLDVALARAARSGGLAVQAPFA